MSALQHIIARAARRRLINRAMRYSAWGVIIGLALGLLALLAARTLGLEVPVEAYGAPAAAGLLGGVVYACATGPDRLELAVQLDRTLNLRDRIGTAHALSDAGAGARPIHDEQFAAIVNEQAQRLAQSIDVRPATPIHLTRAWAGAALMAVALWLGVLYLPSVAWSGHEAEEAQREQVEQANQQAIEISESIQEAIEELPVDELALDQAAQEELQALDRLAEQLAQGDVADPQEVQEARDESSARLSELADRLAEQSERDLAVADELAKRFAGMDSGAMDGPKPPMSSAEFSEALRRGDFGKAAQELDELLAGKEDGTDLTEAQRQAAAEHLRELAERVEEAGAKPQAEREAENRLEDLEEALREQVLSEEAVDELLRDPPQNLQEAAEFLERHKIDPETAAEMMRELQERAAEQAIEEQTRRDAQEVSESLERAAEELERPSEGASEEPQTQEDSSRQTAIEQREAQGDRSDEGATEPQAQGESSRETASERREAQEESAGKGASEEREVQGDTTAPQQSAQTQPDSQPGSQQREGQAQTRPGGKRSPSGEAASQPAESGEQTEQEEPGERREGQTPAPSERQEQQQQSQENARESEQRQAEQGEGQERGGEQSQERPSAESPSPESRQSQQRSPDAQDQAQADDQAQQDQQKRGGRRRQAKPSPSDKPSDVLRRMAERRGGDRRNAIQRLREAAKSLSDQMSPQERQRWARQWQQQQGTDGAGSDQPRAQRPPGERYEPSATEDVDLRGDEEADQLVAEWLSDEEALEGEATSRADANAERRVQRAQEIAERAVNESAVQKRYHKAIKRYFGRLGQPAPVPDQPQ